ncbi:MAG: TrkA C-terminal domain-containing protein [Bacteroidota bacterium]
MVEIFQENALLLLFVVAAIGYLVGSIKVRGSSLGVAAVLFVGLVFGALDPNLRIPELVIFLGLSIFIYTIALQSGGSFFATFQSRTGARDVLFIFLMLLFSAGITVGLHFLFDFDAATTGGLYSGVSTNTPSLAGLIDFISKRNGEVAATENLLQRAVIGYSLSYPMGVIGVMIAIKVMQNMLKIDYLAEAKQLSKTYPFQQELDHVTVHIQSTDVVGKTIRDVWQANGWKLAYGRLHTSDDVVLPSWDTVLLMGDELALVGNKSELQQAVDLMGEASKNHLSDDRSQYDIQDLFVSNPEVAGQRIASLNLNERYSVLITRIQRGDIKLLASGDTVLELGDRVRITARRSDIDDLKTLFGDSYERLSHINLLSFGLGMAVGLLLGMIGFQFTDDIGFRLGFAGGPLIVGLILGALRRTGPIVWTLSYGANLTMRQFGLILLLAGIGINSGHTFFATLQEGEGGWIFLAGTIISILTAIVTLVVGYKLLKIPFTVLLGMVSNQPAILDFATEQSGNRLPIIGFTLMLPIALITKIVVVQVMYLLLSSV